MTVLLHFCNIPISENRDIFENGQDIVEKEVLGYFLKVKIPIRLTEFRKPNPTEVKSLPYVKQCS